MSRSTTSPDFPQLLQNFFCKYLINQRNVSSRTVESYRDTFRLFLRYLGSHRKKCSADVTMADLTADSLLGFLEYLEKERHNCPRSRNARFAAIRSFLKYAAAQDPTRLPQIQQALAIPMKRFACPLIGFLSREEVQALLSAPDVSTWSGRRDRVMFATFYNTGARVSEVIALQIKDVSLNPSPHLIIHGKGRKQRSVPLWKHTAKLIHQWLKHIDSDPQSPLFPNVGRQPLTRSGIENRLKDAVRKAIEKCPSLHHRSVSPHVIRHTTAMHLLQSGVDLTVIALWLGHEDPSTTQLYLEADMTLKENALRKLQEPQNKLFRYQASDKLLQFLEAL